MRHPDTQFQVFIAWYQSTSWFLCKCKKAVRIGLLPLLPRGVLLREWLSPPGHRAFPFFQCGIIYKLGLWAWILAIAL